MISTLKLIAMLSVTFCGCTATLFDLLRLTINNLNSNYCTNCKCKISKSNLHKKIKKIFYLPYKKSICVDCFIEENNLFHVLSTIDSFTKCQCGSEAYIKKDKYFWVIGCKNCNKELVDPTLNGCFIKWEEI